MVDRDQKLRLYVYQEGWKTAHADAAHADAALRPGHWHQVGVVVHVGKAELWLNGKLTGQVKLRNRFVKRRPPLTLGGVDDNGRIWQYFQGALGEVMLFHCVLNCSVENLLS